ncbi:GNAT family N-acetyltransferase [Gimesia aquarii]|uniref:BioF2-like acetyltransferase domain-containing protein n=1 Tax=Gimesia aquarii TaxID=2527964 RepID=A0A517VWB1_9PLAN|nr:GNAT family N-acetyltransferase [Gimesia aquarii]QDT97299.1 hypothetical protein V144x_27720 [Gimesia aquarii]
MKTKLNPEQQDNVNTQVIELSNKHKVSDGVQFKIHALDCAQLQPVSELYQTWMQLYQNDINSDLYQHPDYIIPLLPILAKAYPQYPGYLMQCYRQGTLIAAGILLPKNMSTKVLKGLGPARLLPGYYLSGNRFLVQPELQQDKTLLKSLLESATTFCHQQKSVFLLLDDLLVNDPLNKIAQDSETPFLKFSHTGFQDRSLIHFPENPIDYWKQFRSKSRGKQRRLLRQNSEMTFIRVTEPDQVADFLEAAHQISLNTWQTQRLGLRIKNDDMELEELVFLASNGFLRCYMLKKDDQPVAFKIGHQHKGVFRDVEVGFDLDYASKSPGEALLLMTLDDLIQHDPPHTFDFGEGDAEYKQRYSSEITQSGSVLLLAPTIKNKLLLFYLKSSRVVDRNIRKVLKATGTYTAIRQLLRYGKLGSR